VSIERRALLIAAAALASLSSLTAGTTANAQGVEAPALRVDAGDGKSASFTLEELQALPSETARALTREGGSFEARGVSVVTLLKLAGLDLNANLGGSAPVVGRVLLARAADGYVAAFGLAELDPHFGHAPILVVWTTDDGALLPPQRGPLALVVPYESRPGRWVRKLVSLEVRDLR